MIYLANVKKALPLLWLEQRHLWLHLKINLDYCSYVSESLPCLMNNRHFCLGLKVLWGGNVGIHLKEHALFQLYNCCAFGKSDGRAGKVSAQLLPPSLEWPEKIAWDGWLSQWRSHWFLHSQFKALKYPDRTLLTRKCKLFLCVLLFTAFIPEM